MAVEEFVDEPFEASDLAAGMAASGLAKQGRASEQEQEHGHQPERQLHG